METRSAEAHYLLAKALLATGSADEARNEITRARAVDEQNIDYKIMELEVLRRTTPRESSVSLTDGRRLMLAHAILEERPDDGTALEELGLHHAMNYRWYANFDATKEPLGNGVANKALSEFEEASDYLSRSIASDSRRLSAYMELLRLLLEEGRWDRAEFLARQANEAMPDRFEPLLYQGLIAQLQQQSERARRFFDRSLAMMSAEERAAFVDVSLFLDDARKAQFQADPDVFLQDFWSERDPIRLTEVNERKMDHYARLAYCELWYGGNGRHGWESERGKIVVRYGIPWRDTFFGAGYSRFNVLAYRDFEFVFEDMTRGGHFSMYSPKAGAGSSWANDYVIKAGEMAISMPEAYDPQFVTSVVPLVATSAFKGSDHTTDVFVHLFVPDSAAAWPRATHGTTGVFLLDDGGNVLAKKVSNVPNPTTLQQPDGLQMTQTIRTNPGTYRILTEYVRTDHSVVGQLEIDAAVPDFGEDSLAISDLMAASSIDEADSVDLPGAVRRSGYAIQPMPWTRLEAGSDLLVYFELYGLRAGEDGLSRYRVNAILEASERKGGVLRFLSDVFGPGDASKVAVSFETSAEGPDVSRFLSVGLPIQGRGHHNFVLEVTDLSTGQKVRRTQDLNVVTPNGH